MTEFNLYITTSYQVRCESCGASSGEWSTTHEVKAHAKALGFIAVDTPEDGTLNFCSVCYPVLNAEAPQPTDKDAPDKVDWRYETGI